MKDDTMLTDEIELTLTDKDKAEIFFKRLHKISQYCSRTQHDSNKATLLRVNNFSINEINLILNSMTKEESKELYQTMRQSKALEGKEKSIKYFILSEMQFINDQDVRNRIVNRVATVIKEEFGKITEETEDYLNSIRVEIKK